MKTFVVILVVAGLASADIGLGYHYGPSKPQTSYGTPSYSSTGGSSAFNSGYTGQNTAGSIYKAQTLQSSGSNLYQTSSGLQNGYPSQVITTGAGYPGSGYQMGSGYQTGTGYQSGNAYQTGAGYQSGNAYQTGAGYQSGSGHQVAGTGYQSSSGYHTDNTRYQTGGNYAGAGSGGSQYQTSGSQIGLSSSSLSGAQGLNQYQSANQYQSNAVNYYSQVQQPPQIFKHFYVHAAPEEPELPRVRQQVVLPAPQKHYKIIFIKTPAPAAGSTQFIPVQPQNEEKTIVYVLVKKPEEAGDIVVPPVEQKPPSKPEVYFIKYKGKEDSQAVINNIVNEYNSGKESINVANTVHSTGTLDSILDAKYTSQSGSINGDAAQVLTGSSGTQYESSAGDVGQSLSSGSTDSGSSNSGYQSQSFGTSTVSYPSPTVGYQVSTAAPIQVSTNAGGYDSSSSGFSSTASSAGGYGQVNTISINQGVPHETYGPPKF